jgi:hypothetical protein
MDGRSLHPAMPSTNEVNELCRDIDAVQQSLSQHGGNIQQFELQRVHCREMKRKLLDDLKGVKENNLEAKLYRRLLSYQRKSFEFESQRLMQMIKVAEIILELDRQKLIKLQMKFKNMFPAGKKYIFLNYLFNL